MEKSKVYVLLDSRNRVMNIDGGYNVENVDIDTWTYIDEGYGDKYNLCHSHYLPKPIWESRAIPQYKYVDGQIIERTQAEIDADYVEPIVEDVQAETDEMLLDHEERLILLEVGE